MEMFYSICDEICYEPVRQSLTSLLFEKDEYFTIYFGFIQWITIVMTGLGMEMFMVLFYVSREGWNNEKEIQWLFVQFLLSIMALVTLGLSTYHNYISLVTLIFWCWKCGCPETVASMFCALYDNDLDRKKRMCLGIDSIGSLLHHSAASLLICMLLTGKYNSWSIHFWSNIDSMYATLVCSSSSLE